MRCGEDADGDNEKEASMNGEEEGKLPDLQDAVLNDEQLGQLFRDYHRCIDVLQIVVKQGRGRVADGEVNSPSLEEAEHLIRERKVRGLQIRYAYDEDLWWDTLMPVSSGVRLVRILHSPTNP
jgi:hypothetical protein